MSSESNPRSPLENVVFGVSLALMLALVGALAYEAFAGPSGPPDIRVRVAAEARGALVPVEVENRGGTVAEAVRVEVCAPEGSAGSGTCAEVDLDYVPVGATRRAVVGFREAPAGPLSARVVSYLTP